MPVPATVKATRRAMYVRRDHADRVPRIVREIAETIINTYRHADKICAEDAAFVRADMRRLSRLAFRLAIRHS